jgi:hypothetical protein
LNICQNEEIKLAILLKSFVLFETKRQNLEKVILFKENEMQLTALGVIVLLSVSVGADGQFCTEFKSDDPRKADFFSAFKLEMSPSFVFVLLSRKEPAFPVLPETFEANVEANMISEGYTISAFQVYDYPKRAASMRMKYKNMDYHLIYNYAQDEFYTVSSGFLVSIAFSLTFDRRPLNCL